MSSTMFKKATRQKLKLRMAIDGPAGAGKTFTALRLAFTLGRRVAVINSESGAVEKYLGLAPDGVPFDFDICTLNDFAPIRYTEAILAAGREGYEVIVIDSLTHAWSGSGGALDLKDKKGGNSFTAWKDITPMHNAMIEAILRSPAHVFATMRSKTDYVLEVDDRGRSVPKKVGMAPIQRAGMEYEFDIYASLDADHFMTVTKSRCPEVDSLVVPKPGAGFMEPVIRWLNEGSEIPASAFAVTEADLAKFTERTKKAEKPKTVDEMLAEQAASQASQASQVNQNNQPGSQVVGETAPDQLAPASEPDRLAVPVDKPTLLRIKDTLAEIATRDAAFPEQLKQSLGGKKVTDLTLEQGIALANRLAGKLKQLKDAEIPF